MGNRTLLVVIQTMNLIIDHRILLTVVAPKTLLTPATKEVVADAKTGGAWINRNQQRVCRTGVDESTSGDIFNAVRIKHAPYKVLIIIFSTSPTGGQRESLHAANKMAINVPRLGQEQPNTLKLT